MPLHSTETATVVDIARLRLRTTRLQLVLI